MEEYQLISDRDSIIEHLFESHADSILRMCFLYLNDRQAAEDALQETFIKAYRNIGSFRGDSAPGTWLIRIAVNTCKNFLRSSRELLGTEYTDVETLLPPVEEDEAARLSVCGEIGRLPQKYREVILLYYYQELSMKEISSVLELPQTTVAYRLRQGKKLLRPALKEMYFDESDKETDR